MRQPGVSEASQAEVPEIPWHQIIGLRNRIAHEYDCLNLVRIWDTVHLALPELIVVLERFIGTI